ncbi:MAG: rare lipoprotein A [Chlorobi bacterium OLB5]|nr:MAG: rare lipoprotein A [Chlorobi bacterium OLB5]
MNMKKLIIPAAFAFALFTGCNSSIYEIIEVEETVEVKEEPKQEAPPVTDIPEIKEETKPSENKFVEKNVVSRTYVIQIGAYLDVVNAERFMRSAQKKLTKEELVLKNVDGLHKIRLGNFSTKDDAINYLNNILSAGFRDCFVVELTYIKQETK